MSNGNPAWVTSYTQTNGANPALSFVIKFLNVADIKTWRTRIALINKDLGVQPSTEFNIVACKATVT